MWQGGIAAGRQTLDVATTGLAGEQSSAPHRHSNTAIRTGSQSSARAGARADLAIDPASLAAVSGLHAFGVRPTQSTAMTMVWGKMTRPRPAGRPATRYTRVSIGRRMRHDEGRSPARHVPGRQRFRFDTRPTVPARSARPAPVARAAGGSRIEHVKFSATRSTPCRGTRRRRPGEGNKQPSCRGIMGAPRRDG